jgi:peptidoglycan/xylan/chitin deacetylase (PgdA/CDA1 family)
MRWLAAILFAWLLPTAHFSAARASTLHILSYHDVQIKQSDLTDDLGVTVSQLAGHFAWMKAQGFKVVSLDDVLAAQRKERALPEKAVLLTFDDGLASAYDSVLPLLQVFNYPAVVAVVGSWLTDPGKFPLRYGRVDVGRRFFLSADQMQALAKSPLIEFASHSYDLHRGIAANEVGQTKPAAVVRVWDSRLRTRESGPEYERRIREDLQKSLDSISQITGKKPRAMVWPFGEFTGTSAAIARELGMPIGMTLTVGRNTIPGGLTSLKRYLVSGRTDLTGLAVMLSEPEYAPVRFIEIALDPLAKLPAAEREPLLDLLLERVLALGATHVVIPAWTRESTPRALFENKSYAYVDLMNRIAWQFRVRLGVKVFARWFAGQSDPNTAAGLQHIAAFAELVDTVSLTGVILDFETTEISAAQVSSLAKVVRNSHPDDEIVIAGQSVHARTHDDLNLTLAPDFYANSSLITLKNGQIAPQVLREIAVKSKNSVWFEFNAARDFEALPQSMRALQREGWLNFGWANDDAKNNVPAVQVVAAAFSRRAELR